MNNNFIIQTAIGMLIDSRHRLSHKTEHLGVSNAN